ncbi:hypothetical protein GCM10010404_39420 [Nonomuraea africana]
MRVVVEDSHRSEQRNPHQITLSDSRRDGRAGPRDPAALATGERVRWRFVMSSALSAALVIPLSEGVASGVQRIAPLY